MESGETPRETASRKIGEELGKNIRISLLPAAPSYLTVTKGIDNPGKPCRTHFDIWYFVEVDQDFFWPDQNKIAEEFHEMAWLTFGEARERVTDPNTLQTLKVLEMDLKI